MLQNSCDASTAVPRMMWELKLKLLIGTEDGLDKAVPVWSPALVEIQQFTKAI
jgi:hypothetical protein